jgi:hypothetical protein
LISVCQPAYFKTSGLKNGVEFKKQSKDANGQQEPSNHWRRYGKDDPKMQYDYVGENSSIIGED